MLESPQSGLGYAYSFHIASNVQEFRATEQCQCILTTDNYVSIEGNCNIRWLSMGRLTSSLSGNAVPTKFSLDFIVDMPDRDWSGLQEIFNRLDAYEKTGLEPEEIHVIKRYHEFDTAEDVLLSRRLIELAEADKEGRCVIFQPGYDVVSTYYPADEDGLYTRRVVGVVTREEYDAALAGERNG